MGKEPQSFSIDDWVKEELGEDDETNYSHLVNGFLKRYIEGGRSQEAAIAVQIEHLDERIADHRKEIDRLDRRRDQLEAMLQSKREDLERVLDDVEAAHDPQDLPPLEPDNDAIQRWSEKAQVSPQRFVTELERRIQ